MSNPVSELLPRIDAQAGTATLHGAWTAAALTAPGAWPRLSAALERASGPGAAAWDLRALAQLDHLGALLLWRAWGGAWPAQVQASDDQRALIERVARYQDQPPPLPRPGLHERFQALGATLYGVLGQMRAFVTLTGQLLLDGLRLLRAPGRGPWLDFSSHLYHIGATAMPITALVGFLIGIVLAYLMSQVLRQFGADIYIVNILGIALVRELGPILAAVLVAGRSGSSITAQIGVMRVTEELDAMRVLGIPVHFRLVLPRALALALAMPLITVWTTLAALLGGMLASDLTLGISPTYFVSTLPAAVSLPNLWLAVAKSAVFGVSIALIGCHYGLRVEPNTESLGRGTTASVVAAITAVILLDALFAIVFKSVGL